MELTRITLFTIASAAGATALMIGPGLALAWLLARGEFRGRLMVETFVSMPLVMPPVATGLILLMLCAPRGPVGRLLQAVGIDIVFTWKAVVLAMAVMGLPLFVRTVRAGIEQVDRRYEAVAATLGAPPLREHAAIGKSCSLRRRGRNQAPGVSQRQDPVAGEPKRCQDRRRIVIIGSENGA